MNILGMITDGFKQAIQHKRFAFFFWFLTFFFSYAVYGPYVGVLKDYFAARPIADLFYQNIWSMIAGEFDAINPDASGLVYGTFTWLSVLMVLFSMIFSGGVIHAFLRRQRSVSFAIGSGLKHFKKLFLLGLINLAMILGIGFIAFIIAKITGAFVNKDIEPGMVKMFVIPAFFAFVLWLIKDIFYDYLRIVYMNNPNMKLMDIIPVAFSLASKYLVKLLVFSVLMHLIVMIVFVAGHLLNEAIGSSVNAGTAIATLVVGQMVVWFRALWRYWFFASEINLYETSEYYVFHPDLMVTGAVRMQNG
ncbi:MAG: hypothetical protein Kow00108_10700 [Calditrichia bacterium]